MALSSASGPSRMRAGDLAAVGHLAQRRGLDGRRHLRVDGLHRREDRHRALRRTAARARGRSRSGRCATLSSSVGAMLTAASVMISAVRVARHVHDEAVADAARGAQAAFALDHRAHQLVGVQAALHQRLGLAFAHQLHGRRRPPHGCAAHRRSGSPADVDAELACATASMRSRGPTRIGAIRPSRAASTAPFERALVAGMRDGGRRRRQRLAEVEQALVLFVFRMSMSLRQRASGGQAGRHGWRARCAAGALLAGLRRDGQSLRIARASPAAPLSATVSSRRARRPAALSSTRQQPLAVGVRSRSRRQGLERLFRLVARDDLPARRGCGATGPAPGRAADSA